MRVLFVPLHAGGLPHTAPLIALQRMCAREGVESAFLLPREWHRIRQAAEIDVLPVDYQNTLRSELEAYRRYRPDIVVDDCSVTTRGAVQIWELPRIALVRTGAFEGYVPRNPAHTHSLAINLRRQDVAFNQLANLKPIERVADFFTASRYVVPAIMTIEPLPPAVRDRSAYLYAGPLLLDDDVIARIVQAAAGDVSRAALDAFCERHRDRPRVFMTFGNVATPTPEILECGRRLLQRGIAVISTFDIDGLDPATRDAYHRARFLPMHAVCGRVDVMVHQCGSATYQYGLAQRVPTITIGSQRFDREDVAVRLEALGVSRHLRHPDEEPDFVNAFMTLMDRQLADADRVERLARLAALEREMDDTRAAFAFVDALRAVAASARRPARREAARPAAVGRR